MNNEFPGISLSMWVGVGGGWTRIYNLIRTNANSPIDFYVRLSLEVQERRKDLRSLW